MQRLITLLLVLATISGCRGNDSPTVAAEAAPPERPRPRNVIVVIADGLGVAHVSGMRIDADSPINVERMPVVGLHYTWSSNDIVTDSAAAGTALATGRSTNNGMISVDPETGENFETALEVARARGWSAGLVTTTTVSDATTASFGAHAVSRAEESAIAAQFVTAGIELLVGSTEDGVFDQLLDAEDPLSSPAAKADLAGYAFLTSVEDLSTTDAARVILLFEPTENDTDFAEVSLPQLTTAAIEFLSRDPDGFFLVIESEGTDTASHNNVTEDVIASLRSINESLGIALDFAERTGDTLVLFTGDHETSGLTLVDAGDGAIVWTWASGNHTATAIPIFASGPGAEDFGGIGSNVRIGQALIDLIR